MTTKEAIQAMLDGKKVFLPCWKDDSQYIHFENSAFREETGEIYVFGDNYTDWEIYEEPKPKQVVVIEKWLCETDGRYEVRESSNIKAYVNGYWKTVKLLDTYEVEL